MSSAFVPVCWIVHVTPLSAEWEISPGAAAARHRDAGSGETISLSNGTADL